MFNYFILLWVTFHNKVSLVNALINMN